MTNEVDVADVGEVDAARDAIQAVIRAWFSAH